MSSIDTAAHDPSAPSGHLPGFAREEHDKASWRFVNPTDDAPLEWRAPSGLLPPAGVDLVDLADQRGELEIAAAGVAVGEALELGARLAGDVVAHRRDRAGRAGVDLGLAGALQPIEPQERLG